MMLARGNHRYTKVKPELQMQAWGRDTEGFNSPLFEDPRTQRAVERKWTQEIQGRMYTRLCFWVRSLLLQSTTATCGAWFACFSCSGLTTGFGGGCTPGLVRVLPDVCRHLADGARLAVRACLPQGHGGDRRI